MKINFHFFVVLFIACVAVVNDFIIYLFHFEYINSLIISNCIISIIYAVLIKKKKILIESNFEKYDVFFFIFWLCYVMLNIGIPDYDWDTRSYHIYLQENCFINKIDFDFFPGRIFCCFLFPLGDRMHYIFRYFFGYRVGTIFSFYIMIVFFYETKILLKEYTNNSKMCSFFSNFIFFITIIFYKFGTYYIDNLGLIFLIQILLILKKEKDLIQCKIKFIFLYIFIGLSIGIKIINTFYIGVLIIIFIIKNIKKIKFNFIFTSILVIFPYIIYFIDNYKQTGSILFPYYNYILKSEYFGFFNWVDPRFGIDGILKKFLWPIIGSFFELNYGTSIDKRLFHQTPIWAIGYIFCIIFLIKNFKSKSKRDLELLSRYALINVFIWIIFIEGYFRYGIFVCFLFCILMYSYIIIFFEKRKFKLIRIKLKLFYYIKLLFSISNTKKENISAYIRRNKIKLYYFCIIIEIVIFIFSLYDGLDLDNIKLCFKDKSNLNNEIKIDGIWGCLDQLSVYESLAREKDVPIINLEKSYFSTQEKTLRMWYDKILNNDIYVLLEDRNDSSFLEKQIKNLNNNFFEIVDIVNRFSSKDIKYIDSNYTWWLVKVKYKGVLEYE